MPHQSQRSHCVLIRPKGKIKHEVHIKTSEKPFGPYCIGMLAVPRNQIEEDIVINHGSFNLF